MNWIMLFVAFTIGAMTMFAMFCLGYTAKIKEPINMNKVRYYVARDKDGVLWLYLGKPIRYKNVFIGNGSNGLTHINFRFFGLNKDDYADLEWEDEPIEVFVSIKN